jgi:hypothetical protein
MSESRRYFTKEEAQALVGRLIRTRCAWSAVPAGTLGRVIRADVAPGDRWDVAIEWQLPEEQPEVHVVAGVDPFMMFRRGGRLVDWFSRDEYERWREELHA